MFSIWDGMFRGFERLVLQIWYSTYNDAVKEHQELEQAKQQQLQAHLGITDSLKMCVENPFLPALSYFLYLPPLTSRRAEPLI